MRVCKENDETMKTDKPGAFLKRRMYLILEFGRTESVAIATVYKTRSTVQMKIKIVQKDTKSGGIDKVIRHRIYII